jgi:hypothetical protein
MVFFFFGGGVFSKSKAFEVLKLSLTIMFYLLQ